MRGKAKFLRVFETLTDNMDVTSKQNISQGSQCG